jgi:hypothetical protein
MELAIPGKVRKSEMSNEIRNESGNKKWVKGLILSLSNKMTGDCKGWGICRLRLKITSLFF